MSETTNYRQWQNIECPNGTVYTIRAGDTYWRLAQRFDTTVDAIIAANPGVDPENLQIGQQICIPVPAPSVCPPGSTEYTIREGDTFFRIAERLGVSVDEIIELNPGVNPRDLRVGQRICIPVEPPPEFVFPCCVILERIEPGLPAFVGGSVLIREEEASVTFFPVTFAVTRLPNPSTFGNFDSYIGSVSVAQPQPEPPIVYSAFLERTAPFGQPATWAGTRNVPDRPAATDTAIIRPYSLQRDVEGSAIMRTTFERCRRR